MGNILPSGPARMTSRCAPPARGVLTFEITGYRQHRGLGAGKFIQSAAFDVGGYRWCIRCYPDGVGVIESNKESKVGVYLELLSKKAKVRANYEFRLVDQTNGLSSPMIWCGNEPKLFNTRDASPPITCWGAYSSKILEWKELEASPYLKDDRLVIECHITVTKEPWAVQSSAAAAPAAEAPRPNLSQNFSKLLETKVGADVTFKVGGREFAAHASVLAARSSVLRAKLSGEPDAQRRHVAIEDTEPAVFEALLQFIYTDSVSASMASLDADEKNDLCERLLVAADRYDVKGLKFVCGRTLSDGLDADTVASLLVLAVRHKCDVLKDACVEFIAGTGRLRDVVSSDGYGRLKESCPGVFVDLFEIKAAMLR